MSQEVYDAWNNPGPAPSWHRKRQLELHLRMPTLAQALDKMPDPREALTELSRVRKMLSDAPHDTENCRLYDSAGWRSVQLPESACNCWKSKL